MKQLGLALVAVVLVACGNEGASSDAAIGTQAVGTSASGASNGQVALGLTERQLLDADLVGANGEELGDVEGLVTGPDGTVTSLLVEIEDSSPDRYVHVPIEGLQPFDDGDDRDLRASLTRDQLMALPAVPR
jgi:hypothetical protein